MIRRRSAVPGAFVARAFVPGAFVPRACFARDARFEVLNVLPFVLGVLPVVLGVLLVAAAAAAPGAFAQDITPRKGFSVKIVEPKANDVVVGEVTIRAEVTARREGDVARVDFFIDDKLVLADTEPPFQVVQDFGKQTGPRVLRVVAHHREGPSVSDFLITRAVGYQYSVDVQRVVLDVSVRDDDRKVVTGLGLDDFTVIEGGRRQKLTSVSPERRPILVGMVIDTSGSMRDRIKTAQDAACAFIGTLDEKDRGFVIDFDEQVTLLEETTGDKNRLCEAVRSTQAIGGTALHDAIHAAYRVLKEQPAERRALVVLSDGDDTSSSIAFDDLMAEARLNDVAVYVIGLSVGAASEAHGNLARIADDTGARSFFIRDAAELAGTYDLIAEELRTLYQVVYASDNQVFDGRFIPIKVEVKNGKKWDVQHRSGYHALTK